MSAALNAPVSETRAEMRMVAERAEELEALEILRELTPEELSELEELKEEVLRDASSTALRLDLRGDMIETLTLDYEVEYDNYGLIQRFDLMNRIVEVIAEVPSTSLDAASSFFLLWVNLSKAYEDQEMNTAAIRMIIPPPNNHTQHSPPTPFLPKHRRCEWSIWQHVFIIFGKKERRCGDEPTEHTADGCLALHHLRAPAGDRPPGAPFGHRGATFRTRCVILRPLSGQGVLILIASHHPLLQQHHQHHPPFLRRSIPPRHTEPPVHVLHLQNRTGCLCLPRHSLPLQPL